MLKARIVGAVEVQRKFARTIPDQIRTRVGAAVRSLGFSLERKVKLEKLAGQVLHRRTGRGVRSVNTRYTEAGDHFISSVGSAVSYLRAWELGFYVPAREIRPRLKKALFWAGARHPVMRVKQKARTMAPRSWLRSALREMRPTIKEQLTVALSGLGQ